jgi:hypothetical protein
LQAENIRVKLLTKEIRFITSTVNMLRRAVVPIAVISAAVSLGRAELTKKELVHRELDLLIFGDILKVENDMVRKVLSPKLAVEDKIL